MKTIILIFLAAIVRIKAQEPVPEITGLEKSAEAFVAAYNARDAAALVGLFTEDGEIVDLSGTDITSGRDDIKAHYEEILGDGDAPSIAIEVSSVRLVTPAIAIEDGVAHLTPPGENEPPRSVSYTAVLSKDAGGSWKIASSRSLRDVTDAAGQLADLAKTLKGEWTRISEDGVRLDLAFGWDPSGKFLAGEMLTTTADSEALPGSIRIGWNAAKKSIVSWMFDSKGAAIEGIWTATDDGWLIRAEGTTADGETFTASQEIRAEGNDTLLWNATNRVIDGGKQPDNQLRLVRQPPEADEP